jgi:hypothetical protein
VLERAREVANERLKNEVQVPDLVRVQPLAIVRSVEDAGIRLQGYSYPPTPSETERATVEVEKAFNQLVSETRGTGLLDAPDNQNLVAKLRSSVQELRKMQTFFSEKSAEAQRAGQDAYLLPRAFVERQHEATALLNEAVTAAQKVVAQRLDLLTSEFYITDITTACDEKIKSLQEKAAAGDKTAESSQNELTSLREQLASAVRRDKKSSDKRKSDRANLGHVIAANEIIKDANTDFTATMKEIDKARTKASKLERKVSVNIDRNLEAMSTRVRSYLSERDVKIDAPELVIVDSYEDLTQLKNNMQTSRERQMIASLPEVDMDEEELQKFQEKVQAAASSYVDRMLSRTLFGVRHGGTADSGVE